MFEITHSSPVFPVFLVMALKGEELKRLLSGERKNNEAEMEVNRSISIIDVHAKGFKGLSPEC